MIDTIYGEQDESTLVKKEGRRFADDAGIAYTDGQFDDWIEYRNAEGILVHRSVISTKPVGYKSQSIVGQLG